MSAPASRLNEPAAALASYLEELLHEPAAEAASPPVPEEASPESPPQAAVEPTVVAPAPESDSPPEAAAPGELALLLLSVKGVTLALPRQQIAAVYGPGEGEEACMGLLSLRDVVFPPGHPLREGEDEAGCVVALAEGWGLLCDAVAGEASVAQAQIKSAGSARARPWLAGMIEQPRCWLIDVPALIADAENA